MFLNVVASASLGLLVGAQLGLSVSPVLSTFLGAVVAGAMIFLSLDRAGRDGATPTIGSVHLVRIAAFSLFTLVGSCLGIVARSNNLLGTSPLRQQYKDLLGIGVSEQDARAAVLARFGKPDPNPGLDGRHDSVLFSAAATRCADLRPDRFASPQSAITAFRMSGNPWSDIATQMERVDAPDQRMLVARVAYEMLCPSVK